MNLIEQCQQLAKSNPGRIVFPDGADIRAIKAALFIQENKLGQPILLAKHSAIKELCTQHQLPIDQLVTIDPSISTWLPEFTDYLATRIKDKSSEELTQLISDPLWFGAAMLAKGKADYCVAGNISSTANVLRAGLKVVGLAQNTKTLSSVLIMIPPKQGEILGFADCSVIPQPTVEQLADIAINSAENYERITGNKARVAMLSFSSNGSAKHPNVTNVQQATQLVRERMPELCIDGEIQFDAAIVPEIAAQKVPNSPLEGKANVFVFPSLEAGNIGYKIAQRLGGYEAIGPLIQGINAPLHDLSRGCSWQDMVQVAMLAAKMSTGTK